ncbi:hypothetical protein ACEPQ9_23345 [Escherichia coli]
MIARELGKKNNKAA